MDDPLIVGGALDEPAERFPRPGVVVEHHRPAAVTALADGGVERDIAQEGHPVLPGELAAAALDEDGVFAAAVGTAERTHVLDDPEDGCLVFAEHL